MRCGFAALIGRPNVGKSTLLNRLLKEKVAIVSPKPQTTRTRILGVVNRPDAQVALFDTPGVHQAKGALNTFMVDVALTTAQETDVVLFLVEADGLREDREPVIGPGNRFVLDRLKKLNKPTFLVLNKIDAVKKSLLLPLIALYQQEYPFAEVVPISAREGDGVDKLLDLLVARLPEGEPMFPPDVFTDQAERVLVGELVREQVLRNCRQEIPYSTAVVVEIFDESEREPRVHEGPPKPPKKKKGKPGPEKEKPWRGPPLAGLVRIHANIYVERESQKAIVIGKRGAMLKEIGTAARESVQRLLGTHVFLSLQVKVEPRWSERAEVLRRFGYTNQ